MELDDKELKKLKELVPYKVLAPTPDEIINEIQRLNNIIEMINASNMKLQNINDSDEQISEFINLLIEYRRTPHPATSKEISEPYFTDIGEQDLKLIKNK